MTEKKAKKPEITVNTASDQQALQQKLMLYQLMQGQLEELKKQAVQIQSRFVEIESTRQALEDVDKSHAGQEVLIALGGGLFANGKLAKGDILVELGAGVMTRKSPEEAGQNLAGKKKEVEEAGEKLQQEMLTVITKMNEIGEELQKAMLEGKK